MNRGNAPRTFRGGRCRKRGIVALSTSANVAIRITEISIVFKVIGLLVLFLLGEKTNGG
jgi:hypothetical protein